MPCDSIQLNRVDVAKMHPAILRATDQALSAEGWRVIYKQQSTGATIWRNQSGEEVQYTPSGEVLTSRDLSAGRLAEFRNTLARNYSKATIYQKAKQHGWKVRQTGPNTYEVQR